MGNHTVRLVACSAAVLFALCTAPGAASASFTAPRPISPSNQFSSTPSVGIATDKTAIVVWNAIGIKMRIVHPDGSMGPVRDVSSSDPTVRDPQVAVAPNGDALIVWGIYSSSHFVIQARSWTRAGQFGPVVTLSSTDQNAEKPLVGIASDGSAVVVWHRYDNPLSVIQGRIRPAGRSFFKPVVDLSVSSQSAVNPQLAINPAGHAVIVWQNDNGTRSTIQARLRTAKVNSFGEVQDLSVITADASFPAVAITSDGSATAVWQIIDGAGFRVQARARSGLNAFGSPQFLSDVVGISGPLPQIAVNAAGKAVATWHRFVTDHWEVDASIRPADGAPFGTVQVMSGQKSGQNAKAIVNGLGHAVVVWPYNNGTINRLAERTVYSGGGLTSIQLLSPAGQDTTPPQITPRGNKAFVVWAGRPPGDAYRRIWISEGQ